MIVNVTYGVVRKGLFPLFLLQPLGRGARAELPLRRPCWVGSRRSHRVQHKVVLTELVRAVFSIPSEV